MSSENIEAARRFIAAFNRRDVDAIVAEVDAEVEGSVYRGHTGISEGLRDLYESYTEVRIEFTDYHAVGDRVAATGSILIRGKTSGAEAAAPFVPCSCSSAPKRSGFARTSSPNRHWRRRGCASRGLRLARPSNQPLMELAEDFRTPGHGALARTRSLRSQTTRRGGSFAVEAGLRPAHDTVGQV